MTNEEKENVLAQAKSMFQFKERVSIKTYCVRTIVYSTRSTRSRKGKELEHKIDLKRR
jgi:hypothetical protein